MTKTDHAEPSEGSCLQETVLWLWRRQNRRDGKWEHDKATTTKDPKNNIADWSQRDWIWHWLEFCAMSKPWTKTNAWILVYETRNKSTEPL